LGDEGHELDKGILVERKAIRNSLESGSMPSTATQGTNVLVNLTDDFTRYLRSERRATAVNMKLFMITVSMAFLLQSCSSQTDASFHKLLHDSTLVSRVSEMNFTGYVGEKANFSICVRYRSQLFGVRIMIRRLQQIRLLTQAIRVKVLIQGPQVPEDLSV